MELSFQRVASGVYLVRGRNRGRFPSSCSLVVRAERTALIDAGCGEPALSAVVDKWNPDLVILSHGHPDHCSGAGMFSPDRLWCPRESIDTTGNLHCMSERYVSPELREEWMAFIKKEMGFRDFTAGNSFKAGEIFDLGGIRIEALHCPGHSEDHYCFYLKDREIYLSTDIDLSSFGPWYANEESDIEKFKESIRSLKERRPGCLVSSHMGVITQGIEGKLDRFLGEFDKREARIISALDRPRSVEDLVDLALIYRKYPKYIRLLRGWERAMVKKHLARLVSLGFINRNNGRYTGIDSR